MLFSAANKPAFIPTQDSEEAKIKNTIEVKIFIVINKIKLNIIHVNGCEFASSDIDLLKLDMFFFDEGWDGVIDIFELSAYDHTGYPVVDFTQLVKAN